MSCRLGKRQGSFSLEAEGLGLRAVTGGPLLTCLRNRDRSSMWYTDTATTENGHSARPCWGLLADAAAGVIRLTSRVLVASVLHASRAGEGGLALSLEAGGGALVFDGSDGGDTAGENLFHRENRTEQKIWLI